MAKGSYGLVCLWDKFWWTIHVHVIRPRPSPHHATPCTTPPGLTSKRVCVSPFLLSSTLLYVHREQPII
jgi:hypothetical protein